VANTWMRDWTASEGEQLFSAMCSPARLSFRRQEIPAVRRFATEFGIRAGMAGVRLADFVLAVSEASACALSHGAGTARLRLWSTGTRVHGEISGEGMRPVDGPGRAEQGDTDTLRRWLLKQICDHVSLEPGPYGVTARFSVTVA
jgi:serine/threonine-protein kinase RsbW